jgi:excisionase family DNA binding protein
MTEDGGTETAETEAQRRLIRADAAAHLLGVPKTWVLAEARADRIPHVRLGRYVRFEAHELEVWWRARRRGPRFGRGHAA